MNVRNWSKKSSGLTEWKWLRSRQTAYHTFIVRRWCNRVHSLYGVDVTAYSDFTESRQSARLFLQSSELAPQPQEMVSPLLWFRGGTLVCGWGGHFMELMWPHKVTLLSKKISIKWIWSVKVTLKVIKRRLLVFSWSCDGVPLKRNKKNSEPPVCPYELIEPNLASQFEWSVNTFNLPKPTNTVILLQQEP